jgi:hypothetical protein
MGIQLSGQVPAEEYNGLEAMHDVLMEDVVDDVVAVVVFRRAKRVLPDDKDAYPILRIARVEVVSGAGEDTARELLDSAYKVRTGNEALDFPEDDE